MEALSHRARNHPDSAMLDKASEGLSTTLEELQVAGEELRQQNEELAAARFPIEGERQRYQELFDFAPDAYLVTDTHGIIREANQATTTLLSAPADFLLRKPLVLFVTEEDRSRFYLGLHNLAEQDRFED